MKREWNKSLAVAACAGLATVASAQVVQTQRVIGFSTYERAFDIIQTADGGFLTVGSIGAASTAPQDVYVVKYDRRGNDLWSRVIGSANQQNDIAYSVRQTSDGGFIIAGETASVTGMQVFLLRMTASGGVAWSNVYTGLGFFDFPSGVSVRELPDGTFAAVGKHQFAGAAQIYGMYLRVTGAGAPMVQRIYTEPNMNVAFTDLRYIRAFGVESIVISGWVGNAQNLAQQALVTRVDLMGNIISSNAFLPGNLAGGISADSVEAGPSLATSQMVWINGRLSNAAGGPTSSYVARVDLTPVGIGGLPWARVFPNMTPGFASLELDNRNLVFSGSMFSGLSAAAKFDAASGAFLAGMQYGTTGSLTRGHAIAPKECGQGYAVAGQTNMLLSNGQDDVHLALTNPILETGCREIRLDPPSAIQLVPRPALAATFIQGFQPWSIFVQGPDSGNIRYCFHEGCLADVDDGSGTGTPDGGVTIDDLLYYLQIFEAGLICADVDDGSSTGTPDGGITIDDLLYFLLRFEAGC